MHYNQNRVNFIFHFVYIIGPVYNFWLYVNMCNVLSFLHCCYCWWGWFNGPKNKEKNISWRIIINIENFSTCTSAHFYIIETKNRKTYITHRTSYTYSNEREFYWTYIVHCSKLQLNWYKRKPYIFDQIVYGRRYIYIIQYISSAPIWRKQTKKKMKKRKIVE